jgi:hypothetical protein
MVRFVSLEISATGVLERECAFSSRTSSLVHSRRFRFLAFFAIWVLSNEGRDVSCQCFAVQTPPLVVAATTQNGFDCVARKATINELAWGYESYLGLDDLGNMLLRIYNGNDHDGISLFYNRPDGCRIFFATERTFDLSVHP